MKNVHLLPTEKPSRLFIDIDDNKLKITVPIGGEHMMNQNIYITNDEEIKDGDWFLEKGLRISIFPNYLTDTNECKKIILTTDQDLINGGVQSIDDDFLEWFVKNPNCEEVEVERDSREVGGHNGGVQIEYGYYEVIIPSKEPKQETLNNMNEEIKKQINLLEEEQIRVKKFINENNFNCTTAPYVIAKQYRDEIKKHIKILKMNLEK